MKTINIICCIFIMLAVSSCSNNNVADKNIANIDERLDNYLDLELKDHQFPGIQYVVFDKDKVLYEYAGGYAKVDAKEKMTSASILNVFSTTKVITAIAILQLAQDERIILTDKAVKYFPELPYKNVTVMQILSHSSGITNALLGNFYIHWAKEHDGYDSDAELLLALKENSELNFKPGEEIGYTNMGYAILGEIIENVSGLKYEEYVTKNIFNRLKLDKTKINFGSQQQKNSALPYFKRYSFVYNVMSLFLKGSTTKAEDEWTSIHGPFYFNHPSHGGIMASANEYAKIFMDLMTNDKSNLLSAGYIKQMFTLQSQYKDMSIAISWFLGEMNNIPYFYHQGGGMGFVAEVRIYPEENIGSIILMNRTDYDSLSKLNILDSEFISHLHKKKLEAAE